MSVVSKLIPKWGHATAIPLVLLVSMVLALSNCRSRVAEPEKLSRTEVANENEKRTPLTGPITYVALGDSTGVGVGAKSGGGYVARLFLRMKEAKPDSKLTNLCVSGATSEDVLRNQLERAVQANPSLVTLGIGINDIGRGVSPEQFAEHLDAILSQLNSRTNARLVVTNIPDISTAPRLPQLMRAEVQRLIFLYNRSINDIAVRYRATVVDIHSSTHEQLASHPEYFSEDGFHPSDAGYENWAEEMWPAVAKEIGVNGN